MNHVADTIHEQRQVLRPAACCGLNLYYLLHTILDTKVLFGQF